MFYNAQKKLAFVMPPRTGTTTFGKLLKQWGLQLAGETKHSKPSEVQLDALDQYTVYGFFRDPVDRYMSLVRYYKMMAINSISREADEIYYSKFGITLSDVQELTYEQFIDFQIKHPPKGFYMDSQVEWLANAQLLDFKNYTPEVLRVARMLGQTQVRISVVNESEQSGEIPTQRVIDYVQSRYEDDYRLGRERGLLV